MPGESAAPMRRRRAPATKPEELEQTLRESVKAAEEDDAQAIIDQAESTTKSKKEPAGDTPDLFKAAPDQSGFPKPPDLQRGFQTIVTDLFKSGYDVAKEWHDIRDGLEIKDALTPDRLKRAANGQEALADRAHQLYIIAKVEVSAYMRETESIYGAIREAATTILEKEKANKTRTKMITEADVLATAAQQYPDEWSDICTRRERAEAMLSHIQNLAALARSRCYTVSNMMSPGMRSA